MVYAYTALFFVSGAILPYFAPWLASRGLSGATIGYALGAGMVVRFVFSLLAGRIADRRQAPVETLRAFGLSAMVVVAALFLDHPGWLLVVLAVALMAAQSPMGPLLEGVGLRTARRDRFSYGLVRAAGSLAFVIASYLVGVIMAPEVFGPEAFLVWVLAAQIVFQLVLRFLGEVDAPGGRPTSSRAGQSWAVFATPVAILAFAASSFVQASHGFYYAFSVLVWLEAGLSAQTIGLLWAWAVLAEIIFLAMFARRAERWGAPVLLGLGAVCAIVRWFAMGLGGEVTHVVWLAALQTLHAGTFAMAHLGAMVFIIERLPAGQAGTAQALNSGLSMGVALAGATALSGVLFDRFGGLGYLAMVVIAVAGLACAIGLWVVSRRAPSPTDPAPADA